MTHMEKLFLTQQTPGELKEDDDELYRSQISKLSKNINMDNNHIKLATTDLQLISNMKDTIDYQKETL